MVIGMEGMVKKVESEEWRVESGQRSCRGNAAADFRSSAIAHMTMSEKSAASLLRQLRFRQVLECGCPPPLSSVLSSLRNRSLVKPNPSSRLACGELSS